MTLDIQSLVPVDVPPNLSGVVYEELACYLHDFSQQKHPDTGSGPAAIRIIVAFAALAREGTVEAFGEALRCRWHLPVSEHNKAAP